MDIVFPQREEVVFLQNQDIQEKRSSFEPFDSLQDSYHGKVSCQSQDSVCADQVIENEKNMNQLSSDFARHDSGNGHLNTTFYDTCVEDSRNCDASENIDYSLNKNMSLSKEENCQISFSINSLKEDFARCCFSDNIFFSFFYF